MTWNLENHTPDTNESLPDYLTIKGYDILIPGRKNFSYGMRCRGYSPGCQPMEGLAYRRDDIENRGYWDILVYRRPLTEEEIRCYQLDPLNNREAA